MIKSGTGMFLQGHLLPQSTLLESSRKLYEEIQRLAPDPVEKLSFIFSSTDIQVQMNSSSNISIFVLFSRIFEKTKNIMKIDLIHGLGFFKKNVEK